METIQITIPRQIADAIGILPSENERTLREQDLGWIGYNIKNRMTPSQRRKFAAKISAAVSRYLIHGRIQSLSALVPESA